MFDIFPALAESYFIKLVFLIHATNTSLAAIGSTTLAYSSYNFIFLLALLLSILSDDNPSIIFIAAAFNAISIVLDVLYLIVVGGSFSAVLFVVVNLLCRPVSIILLLKNFSARAGVEDPTGSILEVNVPTAVPRGRSAGYSNIDESPNQSLP